MRRRRRRVAVALSAALGVVVALSFLVSRENGDEELAELRPDHSWNQTHSVELPPGWTVTQRNVGRSDESSSLSGPEGEGCLVSSWSTAPAAHSRPLAPSAVTVQGRAASYGRLHRDYGPYPQTVLWRDASRRWVGVSCDLDKQGILQMAERVRLARNPMRVPFRLSALPPSLSLVELIEARDGPTHTTALQLEMAGPPRRLTMQISNVSDQPSRGEDDPVERRVIGRHQVEIRTSDQTICFRTSSQPICIYGPGDEPATDWSPAARELALQTAELLTPVQDPGDDASWLEADAALPR